MERRLLTAAADLGAGLGEKEVGPGAVPACTCSLVFWDSWSWSRTVSTEGKSREHRSGVACVIWGGDGGAPLREEGEFEKHCEGEVLDRGTQAAGAGPVPGVNALRPI